MVRLGLRSPLASGGMGRLALLLVQNVRSRGGVELALLGRVPNHSAAVDAARVSWKLVSLLLGLRLHVGFGRHNELQLPRIDPDDQERRGMRPFEVCVERLVELDRRHPAEGGARGVTERASVGEQRRDLAEREDAVRRHPRKRSRLVRRSSGRLDDRRLRPLEPRGEYCHCSGCRIAFSTLKMASNVSRFSAIASSSSVR